MLRRFVEGNWSDDSKNALQELRESLTERSMLALPELNKPFVLNTDASILVVGAVLQQKDDEGRMQADRYASRSLTETESRWPIYKLEAIAIVWAILHFERYLHGQTFTVELIELAMEYAKEASCSVGIGTASQYQPGTQQQHVDIFARECSLSKMDDELIERIGAQSRASWVTASEATASTALQNNHGETDIDLPSLEKIGSRQNWIVNP